MIVTVLGKIFSFLIYYIIIIVAALCTHCLPMKFQVIYYIYIKNLLDNIASNRTSISC